MIYPLKIYLIMALLRKLSLKYKNKLLFNCSKICYTFKKLKKSFKILELFNKLII